MFTTNFGPSIRQGANLPRVAILGTGKMGSAIAGRLTESGFPLTLWNRTRAHAEALGVGSVAGALVAGSRGRVSPGLLVGASAAFGFATVLAAAAPTLPLAAGALVLIGAASVTR